MTPLPTRLRASAQEMRSLESIVRVAPRIARELEEAAQALEAGRGEPVAWRVRRHAFDFNTDEPRLWHYYTGSRRPTFGVPYRCDIEPLYAAPAAQVAQEGDAGLVAAEPPGLTDDQIQVAVFAVLRRWNDDRAWDRYTRESGPYDVTSLRPEVLEIIKAVLAVAPGVKGGE